MKFLLVIVWYIVVWQHTRSFLWLIVLRIRYCRPHSLNMGVINPSQRRQQFPKKVARLMWYWKCWKSSNHIKIYMFLYIFYIFIYKINFGWRFVFIPTLLLFYGTMIYAFHHTISCFLIYKIYFEIFLYMHKLKYFSLLGLKYI